ncbi:hypothetical protein K7432_002339 [Basidiobolus ranarum]|uniref:N-acetyltransferase domain-containing protein n=1 Tax=Basidiobolus ranarum TaxID=34480 RepID=A0ABR2W7X4_9FUNG
MLSDSVESIPELSSKVTTRVATSADVDNSGIIHAMINEAYRTDKSWATESHIVSGERITEEALKEIILNDKEPFILAELGNSEERKIVGCIRIENLPEPKEKLLGLFSVDPEHQSKRIGSTLIAAALDIMRSQREERAVIWVIYSRADIITWYQRLGFYETEKTEAFPWPHLLIQKDVYFRVFKKDL